MNLEQILLDNHRRPWKMHKSIADFSRKDDRYSIYNRAGYIIQNVKKEEAEAILEWGNKHANP